MRDNEPTHFVLGPYLVHLNGWFENWVIFDGTTKKVVRHMLSDKGLFMFAAEAGLLIPAFVADYISRQEPS